MKMEKKAKILVIDDSAETVAGLQNFLSNKYEVLTAANGLDGLKPLYPLLPSPAGGNTRRHWRPKPLLIWCWKSRLNLPNLIRVFPTCSPKRVIDLGLFYF
jgi:hypothetical protein